jgi:hypothetical protein
MVTDVSFCVAEALEHALACIEQRLHVGGKPRRIVFGAEWHLRHEESIRLHDSGVQGMGEVTETTVCPTE